MKIDFEMRTKMREYVDVYGFFVKVFVFGCVPAFIVGRLDFGLSGLFKIRFDCILIFIGFQYGFSLYFGIFSLQFPFINTKTHPFNYVYVRVCLCASQSRRTLHIDENMCFSTPF